jgi:hypothetical protein
MHAGSKFYLKDPMIKVGSCYIIVIQALSSFKLNYLIYLPSIKIFPSAGYKILSKQLIKEDLPAPVLPTKPTFFPF